MTMGRRQRVRGSTYTCCVVGETIRPDQVEVISEFPLGFVRLLFDLLEHCLQIHGVGDD